MNQHYEHCGLFGKIPQQSDFVTHHLSASFTTHWHQWLQSSMSVSQEQLGDNWLASYMVSPIWHFAIMADIVDKHAVVGVVIPSIDEIGRHFPLTLAHIGQHDIWSAYLYGQQWYQDIEHVALTSLADATRYSDILQQLESLSVPDLGELPHYTRESSIQALKGNQIIQQQTPHYCRDHLALSLLPTLYQQHYGNHSLWWTQGSATIKPCLAISSRLPDPGQVAAMLDGNWQQWGWSEDKVINTAQTQAN
ncbi:MAG: type VI secretion system-associated protein TagF [Cellvibrionaceae bacterium]|nr:type VI secretion system-associated protein TagF [Cellvibrionaceae bacterium]